MFDTYAITSNQLGPHPSTEFCAAKHANTIFYRPLSKAQFNAFKTAHSWASQFKNQTILDSGCGTGDSTFFLSRAYPNHAIIGVDQSESRLKKARKRLEQDHRNNVFFLRAKLEDFWRLAHQSTWIFSHHFVFYPNPWPKAKHRLRRWHGHPVFPLLLSLSSKLEVRSNWKIYLDEFSLATKALTKKSSTPKRVENKEGISAFERKYLNHDVHCYSLKYENLESAAKNRVTNCATRLLLQ